MFAAMKRILGIRQPALAPDPRRVRAKYDAAQTTEENRRYWLNADGLSPNASASPQVRAVLRQRGRHEQFNNPYMDGILQTLAGDLIGNGPTLKVLSGVERVDSIVEAEWAEWADAVELCEKLRLMVETRAAAGECFGLLLSNGGLQTAVKLDLSLVEPDQVATPTLWPRNSDRHVDGIVLDRWGNPIAYHILAQHPGELDFVGTDPLAYRTVPAADVIHLFKPRRPGQRRGIPQIASSLPLFNERRGFRQAVLAAARVAAEMGAVVLETEAPSSDDVPTSTPNETYEIERGVMMTAPMGYKAKQLQPAQTGTTYREFDDKLINESSRPLQVPFNIATGNSSGYNYASGRLDHQTYDRMLEIDHGDIERKVMNRIFARWMFIALQIPGYLPFRAQSLFARRVPHKWLWRTRRHVDPTKEADAQQTRLDSLTTSLTDELADEGKDLETHLATVAKERGLLKKYGLERQTSPRAAEAPAPASGDEDAPKPPLNGNGHRRVAVGGAR